MSNAVNERLARLTELGTSIWVDQIQRSLTQGGELKRLVDEWSLRGETSNPAIFEKGNLGKDKDEEKIPELFGGGAGSGSIYQAIAIQDVKEAADVLRPVYDDTKG